MEHFLKSLTNDETQISAIPPQKYGERFMKFITGSTKPQDAVASEKGTISEQPNGNINRPEVPRSSTDIVMQRARHQADLSMRKGASEQDVPDVHLTAIRSLSTEAGNAPILPVVEKTVDLLDTRSRAHHKQDMQSSVARGDPPTPPKDIPENERLPPKVSTEVRPPTPPFDDYPRVEGQQNMLST